MISTALILNKSNTCTRTMENNEDLFKLVIGALAEGRIP